MNTFTLIVLIYAGVMAKGDSVALSFHRGLTSMTECEQIGKQMDALVKLTTKEVRFICVKETAK